MMLLLQRIAGHQVHCWRDSAHILQIIQVPFVLVIFDDGSTTTLVVYGLVVVDMVGFLKRIHPFLLLLLMCVEVMERDSSKCVFYD
jgi:hypothetical protein